MRIAYNNYIDVQRSNKILARPREKEDKTNDQKGIEDGCSKIWYIISKVMN